MVQSPLKCLAEDSCLAFARQGIQKNWILYLLPQHSSNTGVSPELMMYQENSVKSCIFWTEVNANTY